MSCSREDRSCAPYSKDRIPLTTTGEIPRFLRHSLSGRCPEGGGGLPFGVRWKACQQVGRASSLGFQALCFARVGLPTLPALVLHTEGDHAESPQISSYTPIHIPSGDSVRHLRSARTMRTYLASVRGDAQCGDCRCRGRGPRCGRTRRRYSGRRRRSCRRRST